MTGTLCTVICNHKQNPDGTFNVIVTIGPLPGRLVSQVSDALLDPVVKAMQEAIGGIKIASGQMKSGVQQ